MTIENTVTTIEWFDLIVIMNSLISSIEITKHRLTLEDISEDQEYDLEEELEDYS